MSRKKGNNLFKNIASHGFYNACLLATILILSAILFASAVIRQSLNTGMDNMEKRLGSDIMLVPKGAKENAEDLLLEGSRNTFYFDASIYEKVSSIDGIAESTSQIFLKSLSADCCSSEVEIVFFDPETDFVVGPWIEEEYAKTLSGNQVIVGNSIAVEDGVIRLFGQEYPVVAKMAKTGTALDSSVYFSNETMPDVIAHAEEKGSFLTKEQLEGGIISSVFINLRSEAKLEKVLETAHQTIGDIFDVVYPKQLNTSLAGNLSRITGIVDIITYVLGGLLIVLLLLFHSLIMKGRKQEVALLRILGRTRKTLIRELLSEVGVISLSGTIIGCLFSMLIVFPFGTYIGMQFQMPYLGPSFATALLTMLLIVLFVSAISLLISILFILHVTHVEPYLALRREE